jgi:hypothetical protein
VVPPDVISTTGPEYLSHSSAIAALMHCRSRPVIADIVLSVK